MLKQTVFTLMLAFTGMVYYVIVGRINALIIVNGDEIYRELVNKLNTFIDKYANTISTACGAECETGIATIHTASLPCPASPP